MAERVDDLAATIRKKSATLTSYADTLVRNPRSTIEPAKVDSQEQRRAIAAWRALAAPPESGARSLTFEKTIGEGGMGVVHLAEQMTLGRKVAVKTLRDSADPDAVLKLLREAWITGALEHPNVVPVYDVSVDDKGGPLIVLKRIEGLAWADLMHDYAAIEERFGATDPLEWNLRTLGQVCNAIHFAHARGVLHRDLKPGNVMIGGFGEVYVLDWGIAVALHDDGTGRFPLARDANDTAGTPVYMAPEMLGGEGARLSERTDVYLIGAILHEIVSGKPPHDGAEMENIVASIVVSEPKLPPDTDEDLARIVTRAMSREPEDRYQSAEDVRLAIEAYLRHRGSMRLARGATDSLEKLRDAIRLQEVQRRVLYNLLGECRFGYRAALVESQGNVLAKQ
ncbi:MAG: serine/threonine-protein kinase, partial [Polyangiales bacterium]